MVASTCFLSTSGNSVEGTSFVFDCNSGLQVERQLAILAHQLSALRPVHLHLLTGNSQPRFDADAGTTLHVLHGNITDLPQYFSQVQMIYGINGTHCKFISLLSGDSR